MRGSIRSPVRCGSPMQGCPIRICSPLAPPPPSSSPENDYPSVSAPKSLMTPLKCSSAHTTDSFFCRMASRRHRKRAANRLATRRCAPRLRECRPRKGGSIPSSSACEARFAPLTTTGQRSSSSGVSALHLAQEAVQLVRPRRSDPRVFDGIQSLSDEVSQRVFQGDHSLALAEGDLADEVLELVV